MEPDLSPAPDKQTGTVVISDNLKREKYNYEPMIEQRRKGKRADWRPVSNRVLYDHRFLSLKYQAKFVYLIALSQVSWTKSTKKSKSKPDPDVMLPVEFLEALGVSRSNRTRAIKELTACGLLERIPRKTDSHNTGKIYRLTLI